MRTTWRSSASRLARRFFRYSLCVASPGVGPPETCGSPASVKVGRRITIFGAVSRAASTASTVVDAIRIIRSETGQVAPPVNPTTAAAQALSKGKAADIGLPEHDGTTTAVPDLLPRLNLLAAPSRGAGFGNRSHGIKATIARLQQGPTEEILRPIRASAMRSPMAVKILLEAENSSTPELRRYLLRLYVMTICKRMRSQKPELAQTIAAFENAQLQTIYRSKSPHVTQGGIIEDDL